MWPANIFKKLIKHFKNAFRDASFEKMECLKHIFSQDSYQIVPYCTYTGPHLPILFPMWPESQKELLTPGLEEESIVTCASTFNNLEHLSLVVSLESTPLDCTKCCNTVYKPLLGLLVNCASS